MATKQVAVASEKPVMAFSQEAPAWVQGGTGRGSENVSSKDIVLPRIEIVQAQSPIKDTDPDVKEGQLFHSITNEVFGDTVYVIPLYYRMEYLVWKDQDEGGGFFGAYDTQTEAQARVAEEVGNGENPAFLEVVDTPVHYCLRVKEDGTTEQLVISMAKSKAKVSRKWNAVIQIAGGDRFSRVYKLSTFKDKNKQGKTFYNYIVQPAGFPSEPMYNEALKNYEMFKSMTIRADHQSGREAAAAADGEGSEI